MITKQRKLSASLSNRVATRRNYYGLYQVFHRGGMIDSAVGDGILVYFDQARDTCAPAVKAAQELIGRLEAVNRQRAERTQPPILVGIGVHAGSVLVANVGDKRRMVHTVVGEAALVAQALQDVASGGEILVSSEVAASAGDGIVLENGPVVSVKGRAQPVEAFRVAFEVQPILEETRP